MKHLVLVGGGHSHLFVLQYLTHIALHEVRVTLITPSRWQEYSGMLPGWMARIYQSDECRIDLVPLLTQAGIQFIEDSIIGMDAEKRYVCLSDGTTISYDLLSLDVGSESDLEWLQALGDKLVPLRPLAEFRTAWLDIVRECHDHLNFKLAVVGGGAAGVEVALAAAKTLREQNFASQFILVAGLRGVLPDHAPRVQRAALKALAEANIDVVNERSVGTNNALLLSDGRVLYADKVIAATGSKPALWLRLSKLELDSDGYVLVDAHHRSLSHHDVFAAGNLCSRIDVKLPRSGVHAVRVGPVLAHNLHAALKQQPLMNYKPKSKSKSLYLLSCSNGRAILSWGAWSTVGRWAWYLKDHIDRRFIKRFSQTSVQKTRL
jgi:pyridine nucleotide-disulfide oxidoreductase family protein